MGKLLLGFLLLVAGVAGGYYFGVSHKAAPATTSVASVTTADTNVNTSIVGKWKSDDGSFTREFQTGGEFIDSNVEGIAGEWSIFVGPGSEPASVPLKKGVRYLKLATPQEFVFLSIKTLTAEKLVLEYAGGEGGISFTKMP